MDNSYRQREVERIVREIRTHADQQYLESKKLHEKIIAEADDPEAKAFAQELSDLMLPQLREALDKIAEAESEAVYRVSRSSDYNH